MCSSQAQRHWLNPEGNTDLPWVRAGNIMANRVTLLCWLCSALGHSWVIEQPSSKKFGDLPRWRFFCENVIFATWMQIHNFQIFAKMYTIYRGELVLKFDGASCVLWPSCYIPPPKVRVWLKTLPQGFSSADMDATFWLWIVETNMLVVQFCGSEMLQPWPTECKKAEAVPLAHTYVDSRGRKRCVGKKEQLKSSQHLLLGLALFYFDTKRLLGPMEIYTIITVVSVLFVFLRAIEFQNTEGLHNGIWICCCCELLQDACWRLGSEKPTGLNDSTWVFFIPNVLCHWREKKRNRISFAITLMAFSCYTVCGGPTRRWHQCHPRVHDGRTFGWMEWWWSWICAYLSEGKQKFKCATLVAILFGDEQMKGARE